MYGSERLFWAYRTLLPSIYGRMVGVPRSYQPTPDDLDTIRAVRDLQFPLRPRKAGAIFDGFVTNLVADRSHDAQVRTAIGAFIASVMQREGEGR